MFKFTGFSDSDFDAYLPEKWQSRMFTRQRMEVKQKLLSLEKTISEELGDSLSGLAADVTTESPSIWNRNEVRDQRLFYLRDDAASKKLAPLLAKDRSLAVDLMDPARHCQHASVALVIDQYGPEVGVYLHTNAHLDRRNLAAMLKASYERERLADFLGTLPDCFVVSNGDLSKPANQVKADPTSILLAETEGRDSWIRLSARFDRDAPEVRSPDLARAVAERLLESLLPLYRLVAWSDENDHLGLKKEIAEQKKQKKRKALSLKPGDTVKISDGPFEGKTGQIVEIDRKGVATVRLGAMSAKIEGQFLRPARG